MAASKSRRRRAARLLDTPGADPELHALHIVAGLHAGGAELLVAEFAELAPDVGIRVSVLALDHSGSGPAAERLRRLGVEPRALGLRSLLHPRELARVRAHVAAVSPDLVHTHLPYPDIVGGLAAGSLRIPALSTIHSDHFGARVRERVKDRLAAAVRRHCCRRVIAVSAQARSTYLEKGWDSPSRVVVLRNGVNASVRPGAGREIRRQLEIEPDAPVILMLSVLRPEKRHKLGIDAVRPLLERHPSLRLLIAGDGSERASVEAAARQLGDAVRVLGHREDVMELLDASNLLLHSAQTEAFPTALVEAMAASVPVVAVGVGGIPEIVVDGSTGLLVDPVHPLAALTDALDTLLENPALARRMGEQGRARYESEFTGAAWARRLRGLYDEVLTP